MSTRAATPAPSRWSDPGTSAVPGTKSGTALSRTAKVFCPSFESRRGAPPVQPSAIARRAGLDHPARGLLADGQVLVATDWTSDGPAIVVTYRPTDIPEGSLLPSLTARAPAGARPVRIVLQPLDVAATRRLVGSMLQTERVSSEFASFLHEHADGIRLRHLSVG